MNLGTQLKWFHNFWTTTPVAKIPQSLIQKLNYKSNSKLLKRENLLPDGPTAWPKLRATRARTRRPSDAAHDRGSPRALTKLQKSPRAKPKLPNPKSTITPSQPPCKNTPLKTRLYNQVVPDMPPHAGVALADTGRLRRPEEDFYRAPKRETLTYRATRDDGRWFRERRRSRTTPPRHRQCVGSGAAIPVSYGLGKPNKVAYEHR
jgi:hypothetical protein